MYDYTKCIYVPHVRWSFSETRFSFSPSKIWKLSSQNIFLMPVSLNQRIQSNLPLTVTQVIGSSDKILQIDHRSNVFSEIFFFYSENQSLIKGILCAGFYPNVIHVTHFPNSRRFVFRHIDMCISFSIII